MTIMKEGIGHILDLTPIAERRKHKQYKKSVKNILRHQMLINIQKKEIHHTTEEKKSVYITKDIKKN